jgi:predicted nucleotide-binding protein
MVRKEVLYRRTIFDANVLREGIKEFVGIVPKERTIGYTRRTVTRGTESWDFDSEEEFLAEYRREPPPYHAVYDGWVVNPDCRLIILLARGSDTTIVVEADTRPKIETVFEVFDRHQAQSRLPEPSIAPPPPPPPPTIFIGHGRSAQWRDLKDHLHEQHGYPVTAYEIGARAGHTIRDILGDMLVKSSFALLVMTGEDETAEGGVRARQNVVHEVGLFQGRLGFSRAIVLVEDGVEVFSNLQGIDQIRYSKENIKETYGPVLATLRREFGTSAVLK